VPIAATPIVALTDAKSFLNITSSTYDAELTTFIAAASQAIVNRIGQVSGSPTVDEWHDGGNPRLVLRNRGPIQSVTSVTESWGTIDYTLTQVTLDSASPETAFGYTVDLDTGVLVRRSNGIAVCFMAGIRNVHVTYVAGYTTVPADISQACLLLLSHMWETQRGSGVRRPGTPPVDDSQPAAFIGQWPRRVEELLAPYTLPGLA
jgi:uncharacterized phiE125 gp8 family phage protein